MHFNINTENITEIVNNSFRSCGNKRAVYLMTSFVKHMHDFTRGTRLTHEEWKIAIDYLHETAKKSSSVTEELILTSDILGITAIVDMMSSQNNKATPASILGPFYQKDAEEIKYGGDMRKGSKGIPLVCRGTIKNIDGEPIKNSIIGVWHNHYNGLYSAEDPTLECGLHHAKMRSNEAGQYLFTTTCPVPYMTSCSGPIREILKMKNQTPWRPAHVHYKISSEGYRTLTTEYFPSDDPYINNDAAFGVREALIVDFKLIHNEKEYNINSPFYEVNYDFYLEKS